MYRRNHSEFINLILEEILGDESTAEISRKLGFKFDKYKRWLEGDKILRWDEFVQLCTTLNLNINDALAKIRLADNGENIFSYFKIINSFETAQQIASYLNSHVSVVKRYIQGETSPDAETIFKMIDYNTNFLAAFLTGLFPEGVKNPTLKEMILEETKEALYQVSRANISFIGACLELADYKDRTCKTDEWISEKTGISLSEVRMTIKELIELQLLELIGEDHYQYRNFSTNTAAATFKDSIPMLQQFNYKAISILEKKLSEETPTSRPGIIAAQVYPVSEEAMKRVNSILIKAHADMFKEIEDDKDPRTEICCMLLQILPITEKNNF